MFRGWIASVGLSLLAITNGYAEELKFSGYYKTLLIGSKTVAPAGEGYGLNLNRLRLGLKGSVSENVALDLQYDNELLLGNYFRTGQFVAQKDRGPDQYWNLDRIYAEGDSAVGRHRLYRGSVTVSLAGTDVRLGRQRIAWGTGRFWSPLDVLNPLNPIALEREERLGVDAVLAERKLGPLARISAVYAPGRESFGSSAALNWHANTAGVDHSLIAGRLRGARVVGADIATQAGGAGIRAELSLNEPEGARAYRRAVMALDYAFANTLTLSGELYYNGAGAARRSDYDFAALLAGRTQNVGRRYFGGYVSYEITPLIKSVGYLVANLSDRSRYVAPALVYSVRTNVDLMVGMQLFGGSAGSEYQRSSNVYYAQLQCFF